MNVEARIIAFILVALTGILVGGHISDGRLVIYAQERRAHLETIHRLEIEQQSLQTVIIALKDREDRIVQETMDSLGLGEHYKSIRETTK